MRRRERTLSASLEIGHYPVPEKNYPSLFQTLANVFCCMCSMCSMCCCSRNNQAEDPYSSDSDEPVCNVDDSDSDDD